MKLSIGIPAYNRPIELEEALNSIVSQCTNDVEVLISEDASPMQNEIARVVTDFKNLFPKLHIIYSANSQNLGYDANLRSLLSKCSGEYVLFMGDDDRLFPNAIEKILLAIEKSDIGVILRAWQSFNPVNDEVLDVHHYFKGDRFFKYGQDAIASFFRRSVFISGLVVRRQDAKELDSSIFDGLLLYQLYLVGMILIKSNGYYIDDLLVERRSGAEHFFGTSSAEKGSFEPNKLTPAHSIKFLSGLFIIANHLDKYSQGVSEKILKDLCRYSYSMLEVQAVRLSRFHFFKYSVALSRLGFSKSPVFWLYTLGLLIFGPYLCNLLIRLIVKTLGFTPLLGGASGEDGEISLHKS